MLYLRCLSVTYGRQHLQSGWMWIWSTKEFLGYTWRFWSHQCLSGHREGAYSEKRYQIGFFLLQVVEYPVQIHLSKKESYWLMSLKCSSVFGFWCGFRVQVIFKRTHFLPGFWPFFMLRFCVVIPSSSGKGESCRFKSNVKGIPSSRLFQQHCHYVRGSWKMLTGEA